MVNNASVLRLIRMAYGIAHQFAETRRVPSSERPDLKQTACVALVRAREAFRPFRGSFKAYAGEWVRGEITHWWEERVATLVSEYRSDTLDFLESGVAQRKYVDLSWIWMHLKPRPALILRHSYGIDAPKMSDAEIGTLLGVRKQAVHQSRNRAFSKLRKLAGGRI